MLHDELRLLFISECRKGVAPTNILILKEKTVMVEVLISVVISVH